MATYPSQSSPIDNDYHPVDSDLSATNDHWGTKLAGDVVPLRPNSPTVNDYAQDRQIINRRSMDNIAKGGAKAVDPANLAVFPRK